MPFRKYCAAEAGTVLNTIAMGADKQVTDGTVTQGTVFNFVVDYLTQRPLLSGPNRGRGKLDSRSVQYFVDALVDKKRDQVAEDVHRTRFSTTEQRE